MTHLLKLLSIQYIIFAIYVKYAVDNVFTLSKDILKNK